MAQMASDDDIPLPPSVAQAWGLRARATRGRPAALSLERIVEAAVGVAGAEGLDAVSMARVAKALGSAPMSLYRHVGAKDELLALMVDHAVGTPPPAPAGEGWREGLERWAWGYHDVLRRHPWVLQVPLASPPVTPNMTAWLEDGLRSLGRTGLTEPQKLSVMLLLSGYVRNEASVSADIGAGTAGEIMPSWGARLRQVTTPEAFPALHAALASEAFAHDDEPDEEFVFGLERVLDGVAALVG